MTDERLSPACAACPAPRGCFPAPCGLHWQRQAFKAIEERNKFSAEAADLTIHCDKLRVRAEAAERALSEMRERVRAMQAVIDAADEARKYGFKGFRVGVLESKLAALKEPGNG